METCEVTFDETMACSTPVFDCTGDQEIGESTFVEQEQEDDDWGDPKPTPLTAPLEPVMSTSAHGPIPLLLLHGVHSSSFLSLRRQHLRRPQLLLRGGDFFKGGTMTHSTLAPTSDHDR
jgi:hypothetical protein